MQATPKVSLTGFDTASEALVAARVRIANTGTATALASVRVEVLCPDGSLGASGTAGAVRVAAGSNTTVEVDITLRGEKRRVLCILAAPLSLLKSSARLAAEG
eukprot:SAG11_NODE_7941_length_1079_cov_1.098980_2_plen_103_part_00